MVPLPHMWKQMEDAAVSLAKAMGYANAGTDSTSFQTYDVFSTYRAESTKQLTITTRLSPW